MTAPTIPGWWWREDVENRPPRAALRCAGDAPDWWLCPVPTPDDIAAQAAELARLRVEVERLTAIVRDAAEIVDQYAPGFTVWLDEAHSIIAGDGGEVSDV